MQYPVNMAVSRSRQQSLIVTVPILRIIQRPFSVNCLEISKAGERLIKTSMDKIFGFSFNLTCPVFGGCVFPILLQRYCYHCFKTSLL